MKTIDKFPLNKPVALRYYATCGTHIYQIRFVSYRGNSQPLSKLDLHIIDALDVIESGDSLLDIMSLLQSITKHNTLFPEIEQLSIASEQSTRDREEARSIRSLVHPFLNADNYETRSHVVQTKTGEYLFRKGYSRPVESERQRVRHFCKGYSVVVERGWFDYKYSLAKNSDVFEYFAQDPRLTEKIEDIKCNYTMGVIVGENEVYTPIPVKHIGYGDTIHISEIMQLAKDNNSKEVSIITPTFMIRFTEVNTKKPLQDFIFNKRDKSITAFMDYNCMTNLVSDIKIPKIYPVSLWSITQTTSDEGNVDIQFLCLVEDITRGTFYTILPYHNANMRYTVNNDVYNSSFDDYHINILGDCIEKINVPEEYELVEFTEEV